MFWAIIEFLNFFYNYKDIIFNLSGIVVKFRLSFSFLQFSLLRPFPLTCRRASGFGLRQFTSSTSDPLPAASAAMEDLLSSNRVEILQRIIPEMRRQ